MTRMPGAFAGVVRNVVPVVVFCVVLVASAANGFAQGVAAGAPSPSADELLARMRAKYAGCGTWRDHARARCRKQSERHWFRDDEYRIAFSRDEKFRLEKGEQKIWKYRGEDVLWRSGADWAYWGDDDRSPTHDAQDRIVSLAFIDDPIAAWVLPLLGVPGLEDGTFGSQWIHVRPTGDVARESIAGAAAWVVEFTGRVQRVRVGIDDSDAVRRIEIIRGEYRDEIDLSPEFEIALTSAELELSPPGKSGIDPSDGVLLLSGVGVVLIGLGGLQRARRLAQTGRPFMVASDILVPAAGMLVGLEASLRVAENWDRVIHFEAIGWILLGFALVPPLLAWYEQRRTSGFLVIGVSDRDFRLALRAATQALGVRSVIPDQGARATIEGDEISIYARSSLSVVGLVSKIRDARPRIRELQPLVATCIESAALPIDRRASLRGALWSLVIVAVGGGLLAGGWWLINAF